MEQLTASGTVPPRPPDLDRLEALESEYAQAKETERTMREHLRLASAVITAYEQVFAAPMIEPVSGKGALRGWNVQYVDCAGSD